MSPTSSPPGPRTRLIGRAISTTVARAPWLWPLIRRPVRSFFEGNAFGWDERTGAGSPEHLAALAAGALYVKPRPERVLDLGTGTGEGALMLAREFPSASIRGVDVSEEMIRLAQRKIGLDPSGRVAFRVADAASLPYDEDSFDLVTMLNMPPFFAETRRVLRRGGSVIVASSHGSSTPFYTSADTLERGFGRHGLVEVGRGSAAAGEFWIGRLPASGS